MVQRLAGGDAAGRNGPALDGVTAGAREGDAGLDVRGYQSGTGVHDPGRISRSWERPRTRRHVCLGGYIVSSPCEHIRRHVVILPHFPQLLIDNRNVAV